MFTPCKPQCQLRLHWLTLQQMHTVGGLPSPSSFFPFSLSGLLVAPTAKLEMPSMDSAPQAESVQAKSSMDGDPLPPLCSAAWGPSSLGDGEQCGLGCNVPDLDAPVQRDGSHLLAIRVKAASSDWFFVMI